MDARLILLMLVNGMACFSFTSGISVLELGTAEDQPQGRIFFGPSGFPGEFGDLSAITALFSCTPFNRTFVQTGVPCMQRNMTALNCRNETCVCGGIAAPSLPSFPGGVQMPGMPAPFEFPFSFWNCSTRPGSAAPTTSTTTLWPPTIITAR